MKENDRIREWLGDKAVSVHHPNDLAEQISLIQNLPGVLWVDITDNPDFPSDLKPKSNDLRPSILLSEGIFRAGRAYYAKYPSEPDLQEFQDLAVNLATGNVSLQTSTGRARYKELCYVSMTCWQTAARAARSVYPAPGGSNAQIWLRRRDFNKNGPPGGVLVSDSVLCQIAANVNSYALGFHDLLIQIEPNIKIPYYSEVRLEVTGTEGGYPVMDAYLGMLIY